MKAKKRKLKSREFSLEFSFLREREREKIFSQRDQVLPDCKSLFMNKISDGGGKTMKCETHEICLHMKKILNYSNKKVFFKVINDILCKH